jgi:hypothetical protein
MPVLDIETPSGQSQPAQNQDRRRERQCIGYDSF